LPPPPADRRSLFISVLSSSSTAEKWLSARQIRLLLLVMSFLLRFAQSFCAREMLTGARAFLFYGLSQNAVTWAFI